MFMPIQISSRQILHYIHYITWLKWKWVEKSPCEWRCFSIRKKYIANSPRIPTQSTSHCCSLNQLGFFFSCAWCCASFAHSTRTHRHFAIQITKKIQHIPTKNKWIYWFLSPRAFDCAKLIDVRTWLVQTIWLFESLFFLFSAFILYNNFIFMSCESGNGKHDEIWLLCFYWTSEFFGAKKKWDIHFTMIT